MLDNVIHPPRTPHAAASILPASSPQAGSAKKVILTPVILSQSSVRLGRMVRRGCFVRLPGAQALFSIRPADDANAKWSDSLFLETRDGPIEIANGARLIQGLTGIHPGLLQSSDTERRQWFAAALAGRLAGTPFAGTSIAASAVRMDMADSCCLRLTLRSRSHMLTTLARAPISAWLDFLSRSDWSFERLPVSGLLEAGIQETVRIAQHTLPAGVLRTLAIGDVIVPDSPLFQPDGEGRMRLGNLNVRVRYAGLNSLEILDVAEKVTMEELENEAETAVPEYTPYENANDDEEMSDTAFEFSQNT